MAIKNKLNEFVEMLNHYNMTKDVNHYIRRFYRCYLDGSYTGEWAYNKHKQQISLKKDSREKLEAYAMEVFARFCKSETNLLGQNNINNDLIQATVKEVLADDYQLFVSALVEDCLDLINE